MAASRWCFQSPCLQPKPHWNQLKKYPEAEQIHESIDSQSQAKSIE
jgi:hypothetical protein